MLFLRLNRAGGGSTWSAVAKVLAELRRTVCLSEVFLLRDEESMEMRTFNSRPETTSGWLGASLLQTAQTVQRHSCAWPRVAVSSLEGHVMLFVGTLAKIQEPSNLCSRVRRFGAAGGNEHGPHCWKQLKASVAKARIRGLRANTTGKFAESLDFNFGDT